MIALLIVSDQLQSRAGVKWNNGINGGSITATVSGGSGVLNGWIDWNRDSDFADAGEQVMTNTAVIAGNNLIPFNVPVGTFPGSGSNLVFNARFRLTSSAPLSATAFYAGSSSGGEVEDYQWNFTPTAVTLQRAQVEPAVTTPARLIVPVLISSATIVIYRLRRKYLHI